MDNSRPLSGVEGQEMRIIDNLDFGYAQSAE